MDTRLQIASSLPRFLISRMTGRPLAEPGFIAACFRKKGAIAPMNGTQKIFWGTVGDLRGQTIAGLFTTGHRRVRMGNLGVSARSWFGGMKKRNSGADWMFRTT